MSNVRVELEMTTTMDHATVTRRAIVVTPTLETAVTAGLDAISRMERPSRESTGPS